MTFDDLPHQVRMWSPRWRMTSSAREAWGSRTAIACSLRGGRRSTQASCWYDAHGASPKNSTPQGGATPRAATSAIRRRPRQPIPLDMPQGSSQRRGVVRPAGVRAAQSRSRWLPKWPCLAMAGWTPRSPSSPHLRARDRDRARDRAPSRPRWPRTARATATVATRPRPAQPPPATRRRTTTPRRRGRG